MCDSARRLSMEPWNRSLVQRWHGCAGVAEGEASESGRRGQAGGGEPGVKGASESARWIGRVKARRLKEGARAAACRVSGAG